MEKRNENKQENEIVLTEKELKKLQKMRQPLWLRIIKKLIKFFILGVILFILFHLFFNAEAVTPQDNRSQEPTVQHELSEKASKEKKEAESQIKKIQQETLKDAAKIERDYQNSQKAIEQESKRIEAEIKATQEEIENAQSQSIGSPTQIEVQDFTQDLYDEVDASWGDEEEISIE